MRTPASRRPSLALLPFVVLAAGAGFAFAGDSVATTGVEPIIELGSHESQVMDHLDYLCHKIGPRLTGSSNLARAYEWTQGRFAEWGLSNVHTEVWGEYAVGFDRTGAGAGRLIKASGEERKLTIGSNAWTAGTNGSVRGPAVFEPTNMDELAQVKDQLKGAWLVSKGTRGRRGGGRRARGQQPGEGDQQPAKPGAEGTPPALPEVPRAPSRKEREELRAALESAGVAGFVRGTGSELILTDGRPDGITMDKLPKTPQVTTTHDDWQAISDELKAGRKVELEFDVKNKFFAGPVQHKNVIAEIRGSEKPDELVIIGAHLDSWDGAQGATDNGTGVATTLEAARVLAKAGAKPKRTIRFILFSGEEQGLLGSAGYVKAHKDELPKVSCILVHDGGTNYVSGLGVTKHMFPLVEPALAPLASLDKGMPFKVEEVDSLPFGVGSDHDTFLSVGVPGFFWQQVGKQNYDHEHHTQYDTYEAAIPEYQKHSAVTIAAAALAIANLDQLLPRDEIMPRPRKMLGVQTADDLTIEGVVGDSRAEKAGLKEGDRIVKIGAKTVSNPQELRQAIRAAEGETEIRFIRGGKEQSVKTVFEPEKPKQAKRWF
jgi:hypothetical protein